MKQKLFYGALAGFVSGIFVSSFFILKSTTVLFLLLVSGVVLVYLFSFHKKSEKVFLKTILFFLFLFSFSIGALRYNFSDRNKKPLPENLLGKSVVATGIVSDEPDARETNTKLTITLDHVASTSVETKMLTSVDRYSDFHYGDKVTLHGALEYPENFSSDGGRTFDYRSYLAKDGIYYQMKFPKITVTGRGAGNPIRAFLFFIKEKFIAEIDTIFFPPESSFLAGILVAGKASLGKDMQDEFIRAGAIQIVVLSGYNVTVVANAVMQALSFLPRYLGLGFGALGIIAFTLMTGASATVVRAAIMALIALLAKGIGRHFDALRALVIAAFVMIIFNPKILVFDPSFQLSFLATFGLIVVSPLIAPRFTFLTERWKIRETVVASIATQLFVLPYILWQIGTLSFVALFVNVLLMPFIPLTMFLGFVSVLIGFVSSVVAFPFAFFTHALLWYELGIVHFFASLPFAAVSINFFPTLLVIVIYIFYGIILWKFHTKQKSLESQTGDQVI